MEQVLVEGDKAIHTLTNAIVKVIKILPKEVLYTQQAKCKCLKSAITEDIGQMFEYDLDSLKKISK